LLNGKKIVLAVTGSIAAYRAADICRFFVRNGAKVNVLMTRSAQQFVGAATFGGLTGERPITDLFAGGYSHIETVANADLMLIAPATANIMAKLAAGIADDIVTTTVLAADCPVMIAPAMNEKMWLSAATRRNAATLCSLGYEMIGPGKGDLACGDIGWGRLAAIEAIENAVVSRIRSGGQLKSKKILVTAGPTREYLDPARFISNPSSGKMGFGVAEEAARRGGQTILVSGPTALAPSRRLRFVPIGSAIELREAILEEYDSVDAVVMTAAVADHRFAQTSTSKIDKNDISANFKLEKNPDILAELGLTKNRQILVGFAAQTHDLALNGRTKLNAKNLDLLVATKVGFNQGFGEDAIHAIIIDRDGDENLGLIGKQDLAARIIDRIAAALTS